MAGRTHPKPDRIRVEGLGRIAEADVELRPLTLFVGENNSGKSYLATVAWAFAQAPASLLAREGHPAWEAAVAAVRAAYDAAPELDGGRGRGDWASWLRQHPEPVAEAAVVEGDWAGWASELAAEAMDDLLAAAFKARINARAWLVCEVPTLRVARLSGEPGTLGQWYDDGVSVMTPELGSAEAFFTHLALRQLGRSAGLGRWPVSAGSVDEALTDPVPGAALYFPASRTGYLHLLPDVVDRLVANVGTEEAPSLREVTAPVIQFLRLMLNPPVRRRDPVAADLADFLEERILRGRIRRDGDAGIGRFAFRPQHAEVSVPMGRSSAVVSELAPLVTLLRESDRLPRLLVYEEPEAHLHPRLQRIVAQILVRLVKRGTRVLVTTHSDTFVQQVNNQLKLGAAPDLDAALASLGQQMDGDRYTAEDALTPDDVAAYEFAFRADDRSEVRRLTVHPDGVVMPSFNRELSLLAREVQGLNELAEE